MPVIEAPGGTLQPLFEAQPGQRRQPAQLADRRGLDTAVIQQPCRADHPVAGQARQDAGAHDAPPAGPLGELDQALAAIARQTGATLRIYPPPGRTAHRIVLRNDRDDRGTATKTPPSTTTALRITSHDQGPHVNEFWGDAITSWPWRRLPDSTEEHPYGGAVEDDSSAAKLARCVP